MLSLKQIARCIKIAYVWQKYGLDELAFHLPRLRPFYFLLWLNPLHWLRDKKMSKGERLRAALEALGPMFVKFGQILSTRGDLISDEIADVLSSLQDDVEPFDSNVAKAIIEKALGAKLESIFAEFSHEPLASASVAQVHAAKYPSGQEVVVKVLRPGIKKIIKQDISLLYSIASFLERYFSHHIQRLHPLQVVGELETSMMHELDLMREAANASQLKRNFADAEILYVPEIYWDHCRENVLVMERIYGLPATDPKRLRANQVDMKLLAERGVEIFYTQVFKHCFFHADMHPGNVFVSIKDPKNPQYIAIDFGIMGTLDENDKRYLAANFLAFFQRDYRKVAELHVESGWVSADTRIGELEAAIRTVCEPIFEKPLKDISFGQTLLRLFQIARQFHMEVQPQLLLLQKTLLNIEGMGRDLYPELDLWSTAKPFLEKWMQEQVGVKGFVERVSEQIPYLSERLPEVPELIYNLLKAKKTLSMPAPRHSLKSVSSPAYPPRNPTKRYGFLLSVGIILLAMTGITFLPARYLSIIQDFSHLHIVPITITGAILFFIGFWGTIARR